MLIALVGWFVGFDGTFDFANIGDDYIKNNVPYVALRSWPALCGSLVVPLAFEILRELNYSLPACFLGAMLIVLGTKRSIAAKNVYFKYFPPIHRPFTLHFYAFVDNSLVAQSRLILLDSMLMFFMTLTVYCWVKFSKLRKESFTLKWWIWMFATGFSLGLVMGVKMVGLFTVASVGVAVLVDLWYLLDYRKTTPVRVWFLWCIKLNEIL
jgi:dolichyl-phosphate-mannose-protein mannosyltransferase